MRIFKTILFITAMTCLFMHVEAQRCDQLKIEILQNLRNSQISVPPDHEDAAYNGLWWSEIYNRRNSPLFGPKGQAAPDANCFMTALIHNVLAEIFETDSSLKLIPDMLALALPAIEKFRNGEGFHFFPAIEDNRRASHYDYPRFTLRKVFNIYNDTDDTSMAYYAHYLGSQRQSQELGYELLQLLKPYRDTRGSGMNAWNFFTGISKNTGAFETWMPVDTSKVLFNIIPRAGHPYVPLGVNGVDCVVNANILGALAGMGICDTPETVEVSKWLIQIVKQKKCQKCANYYPSANSLAYAMAVALKRGAQLLQPAVPLLVKDLVNAQQEDGSWSEIMPGNTIQATLLGLNALIYLSEFYQPSIEDQINKGVDFLVSSYINNEPFWSHSGGVAGSAGFWFKRDHVWLCKAWSQTLLLEILCNYDND